MTDTPREWRAKGRPYLGNVQRKLVADMIRYGNGMWPLHWKLPHDKKQVLESLRRRGIVTLVRHSSGQQVYRLVHSL